MISDEADRCGPPLAVFRTPYIKGMRFELRPISRTPPERTVALMYRRTGDSYRRSGVGVYRDGRWENDKRKVLEGDWLWAAMVDERAS